MYFESLIEKFLSYKKVDTDFFDSSIATYRAKINVFCEYMIEIFQIHDANYETVLRGMNEDELIKILVYYVDTRKIHYKVTATIFMTVIKEFFAFLIGQENLKNDVFVNLERLDRLNTMITENMEVLELQNSDEKVPISEEAYYKLNNYCNNAINEISLEEIQKFNGVYSHPYDTFISAIMTKVVMFFGIKPQILLDINRNDYDRDLNMLRVRGYWIHLPNILSSQLSKYAFIRDEIHGNIEGKLFLKKDGGIYIGSEYSQIFKAIYNVFDTCSAEIVGKYAIMEMIKQGINVSVILDLTGFGVDTYFYCQESVNDEISLLERTKYLDAKIRKLKMFDHI